MRVVYVYSPQACSQCLPHIISFLLHNARVLLLQKTTTSSHDLKYLELVDIFMSTETGENIRVLLQPFRNGDLRGKS